MEWGQKDDNIFITINVIHSKAPTISFSQNKILKYSGSDNYSNYEFEIELFGEVLSNECNIRTDTRNTFIVLKKKNGNISWPRLIKEKKRLNWIKIDWNYYNEDKESEEEEQQQNISPEQNIEKDNKQEEFIPNNSSSVGEIQDNKKRNYEDDIEYFFKKHFDIDEKSIDNSNILQVIKDKETKINKSETILRIFLLCLSKTYENNVHYNEKYEFLKEFDEMLDSDLCIFFHEIKQKINDELYEKIKKIITLMDIIGDYDYIIYRYIKNFGDNPTIFIEIFSILYEGYFFENCKFLYDLTDYSKDVYQQMYEYIEKKIKKGNENKFDENNITNNKKEDLNKNEEIYEGKGQFINREEKEENINKKDEEKKILEIDDKNKFENKDNHIIINDNKETNEISKQEKNEKKVEILNLYPKKNLKQYFIEQYKKYSRYISNINNYFLFDLANKACFQITDKFQFQVNYADYPIITRVFNFILEMLKPIINEDNYQTFKEYQGKDVFGITILDGREFFYAYQKVENYQDLLNSNLIKKYQYYKGLHNDNNVLDFHETSTNKFNDNEKEIEYHFLASNDLENKVTQFFEKFKQLSKLPSYFFALRYKIIKPKKLRKFQTNNPAIDSPFNSYIETDAAFLYTGSESLTIMPTDIKEFLLYKEIKIELYGDKFIYPKEKILNELKIDPNTVIIIEDKLIMPAHINNTIISYKKDDLFSSLDYIIYKTISKINYYREFIKYELEIKNDVNFHLLLVYNKKPIVESEIVDQILFSIKSLKQQNLIVEEKFTFQVIYVMPNIITDI